MSNHKVIISDFLSGYFHQDWDLDHATWRDVVMEYKAESPPVAPQRLANAIQQYLAEHDGDLSWAKIEADFNPSWIFREMSPVQWLEEVRGLLA